MMVWKSPLSSASTNKSLANFFYCCENLWRAKIATFIFLTDNLLSFMAQKTQLFGAEIAVEMNGNCF